MRNVNIFEIRENKIIVSKVMGYHKSRVREKFVALMHIFKMKEYLKFMS